MSDQKKNAPGAPGMPPKWTSSSKSGIGKSLSPSSAVAFTLSHGILNEVYYPREDIACIRDMEMLITDGENFYEEKRHTSHHLKTAEVGIPAYELTNTGPDNIFQIKKEIIVDPHRDTLLQRINFKTRAKDRAYRIFSLLAPHINNQGRNNTGWVDTYKGVPMFFAQNGDITLALACSEGWLRQSAGYVGTSDGWTDISRHKSMEWEYPRAESGNIALTGEIDIADKKEFVLALSFGRSLAEAGNHARASLLDGFDKARERYIDEWKNWQNTLKKMPSKNYKVSAAVLRTHEANSFPGGIIASLSIPWGDIKDDRDDSGYHLVWPRDLALSSGGFLALEAHEDVSRILNYLMSTQNQDGSWPQNMWLEGEPNWRGLQMDQIALPLLETYKAFARKAIDPDRMTRYWPLARKAIVFLLKNGPYTLQDRWEEEKGYTPFTMATEIAGLLAGAELAKNNGDKKLADFCRDTADNWNAAIDRFLYVKDTPLARKIGVEGYYIRVNPYKNLNADQLSEHTIFLKNRPEGEGEVKLTELISVDALALVRFGLRKADDPRILNTLKVIDALLKVETPYGDCWHRYNGDGYGEKENGAPFDGTGIGRAWPLLTGERAHYEIAAGNLKKARELIKAMDHFSHYGLLPEQIWDTDDIPERRLYIGKHTGSAMPLTWANAEYLKLCASISEKKIFDMPSLNQERYIDNQTGCAYHSWRFDTPLEKLPTDKFLRIEVFARAEILWTDDNWETRQKIETEDTGTGVYYADIKKFKKDHKSIAFTFYWTDSEKWENENFTVKIVKVKN